MTRQKSMPEKRVENAALNPSAITEVILERERYYYAVNDNNKIYYTTKLVQRANN